MTDVMAQPCIRSSGPNSPTGIKGPGLITGTAAAPSVAATSGSMGGAVTLAIVFCFS
ncbi:hypothetical protein MMAD_43870 [Mycolicibacterium madagascariense]|uniref:Uncharacterized protein n=1 Tax=Mycolicibacterium madagascariense TaxID=212765 RepID=A0A7I7XM21_9MYCO|nr:hypothetical protein MMAD_43870 [Mycolicibacterium madagascariense]